MRPSELFAGARAVPVALGLTPKLQALRAQSDGETKDESIPLWQPLAKVPDASNVWHHQQVQDLVLKFWDLYRKDEDNTITEEDFAQLSLRFLRIFLPGLTQEEEKHLCQNCWQEAAAGRRRLSFLGFFPYLVRLVQSWTDSSDPNDYVEFLQNLLDRCTCFQVAGQEQPVFPKRLVTFRAAQRGDDLGDGFNDFMESVELVCSGSLEEVQVELQFEVQHGINFHSCFFEEHFEAPAEPCRRVWMDLGRVWPLGYASLVAIRSLWNEPPMTLNCSDKKADLLQSALETLKSQASEAQAVCQISEEGKVLVSQGEFAPRLFSAVVNEGMISGSFVLKPNRGSFMLKLSDLRKQLLLPQSNARWAAESMGSCKPQQCLPSFPDLLSGAVVMDPSSALAKPPETESLLDSGSLRSIADMYMVSKILRLPAMDNALEEPGIPPELPEAIYEDFTRHFPTGDEDLLDLARTSPLVLWVFGQCDSSGDYKTEVCRRLAEKMQLQWLQPNYVLELVTKTPSKFRSPLQQRCVQQLQRGMVVSLKDALRLTMEMMSSALCKTNGYILDFPAVSPEEIEEVSEFFEQVKDLSGKGEVPWGEVLQDTVELPPLAPEPEPPKPPVEETEGGEGGEGGEAGAAGEALEAAAAPPADEAGAETGAVEGAEGVEEEQEPAAPVPEAPKPNCWANVLPRRMVILSMEKDEVGEWRLQSLKKKHEEKERIKQELIDAGEDVPEEEEEEPEELPQLPEDEEEQQALFDQTAGDQLRTMAPFVPLKSLESPQRLPAAAESKLEPETIDRQALKQGELRAVEAMRRSCPLPLLSLQMDGRPPQTAAEQLEVFTGPCGRRVPLPVRLEGASEPKELLRLNLEAMQFSRRWSPWRLHCPVSLYEKQLTPGVEEFAVDYAGYVFLFAGEDPMRRFCQWPKRFLTEMPCINAPGMTLGFVLLSPASFRATSLVQRLHDVYGFDVVDPLRLLQLALKQPPMPEEIPEEGTVPVPLETEPYLLASEYQELRAGKTVSTTTFLRLIAKQLGIEKNLTLIQKQAEALEDAKKRLEEAQANGSDPPEGIVLDDEGQPVVELEEPLKKPSKGYVLQGFPESAEQLEAMKLKMGLVPDQVLLLKVLGEEAPETLEILQKGLGASQPLQPLLETQLTSFEGLTAVEGLKVSEVALEVTEDEQFVQIRKHIDPFYQVVEAEAMAAEIPDPEEWTPPEEEDPDDPAAEPEERPIIQWGTCGPYCPVTLKEQRWLYPGQKDFQHVYRNFVFALGNERASEAFVKEPAAYVQPEPALPPPRILVTGPTGSDVARQCEMLGEVYKIPVLKLEEVWRSKVEKRLMHVKEARKAAQKKEALEQSMLEDDKPLFPEGWMPPEEVPEDAEDPADQAPPEEEDGLDDEQREELFVMAMKDSLGPHCGACILDGTWFGDLKDEEMSEEMKTARSLQNLLVKAQRLPDFTVVLKCKNDFAAKKTFDFESIDRDYEARLAEYKAQVAAAEAKEEEPPEAPEGLVTDETEEKESDRVKARFIESKSAQQQVLKDMMEVFQTSRVPLQKVSSDRGDGPTHKAIRSHCRPYLEQRGSLLLRHQLRKVSNLKADDQLRRGLICVSGFGHCSPTVLDAPNFPNQTPGVQLGGRIYFPQSETQLAQFLEDPARFLGNPGPSPVQVCPAISVVGGPLSGKTSLAKELAQRTGAVYISVPEALSTLMSEAVPCQLSKDIRAALQSGQRVPDPLVIQAIRFRLLSPDALRSGWVLDDFPCTKAQAEGLTALGIVPHRVFMLLAPEAVIYARAAELKSAAVEGQELQQELALQRERLQGFSVQSPALRVFYATIFENVRDIDASRSKWAIFDRAMEETTESLRERLKYYRRTAMSLATRVKGMCFTSARLETVSAWKHYCPVTLSLQNELVCCYDRSMAVEYNSKVYWMASEQYAELFTEDPEAFLQVPLPQLPRLLDDGERARKAEARAELSNFCPVTLVETGNLVKASAYHLVEYNQNLFRFANREAALKFMRQPLRYRNAKLPKKLPAEVSKEEREASHLLSCLVKGKDGRGLQPSDMVTYMQASLAELICQGLVECGERRPLFPGKGPEESALLCLSRFLRARNPLNTEMYAGKMSDAREEFLKGCALPSDLKEMTEKKMSPDYAWTSTETAKFQELCARFDEVFSQQS